MKNKQQAVQHLKVKTTLKAGSCENCTTEVPMDMIYDCDDHVRGACIEIGRIVAYDLDNSCPAGTCVIPV